MESATMNVNKYSNAVGVLAVISLAVFFYTKGTYIPLYVLSMIGFVLYFVMKKQLLLLIPVFFLGVFPVAIEYFYGDFGKKIFVIFGGIFVVIMLIRKHKNGENIWY